MDTDMDDTLKHLIWRQFGAAIDMLENAIVACPETLWRDPSLAPAFWNRAYHTLFFLDFYLARSADDYVPPPPFTRDELDPADVLPAEPYEKAELQDYLATGREACRRAITEMTADTAIEPWHFRWGDMGRLELLLYNMRHVQHHAAQLNLLLRQNVDAAPRWVSTSRQRLR
jgi:hypothetical protein